MIRDLVFLGVGVALSIIAIVLRSYGAEKGKNLATKEDIAVITRTVETIRVESQARLNQAELVNRTQYELELQAYRELWDALLPVHRAAAALRPAFDYGLAEGETDESRRRTRLKEFSESFNPFSQAVWKHRPFYPAPVFQQLSELLKLMHGEAIEYQIGHPQQDREYWTKAMANVKAMNEQVDRVCDAIRDRLSVARVA
jgi:hypothetical protein